MFVLYSFSAIGLIWAAFGLDLLTEADHCKVTASENRTINRGGYLNVDRLGYSILRGGFF